MFSTFEQVDSSSTRKYGGTGLGLAISKSLTELMQGEIGFTSKLGVGSTFWFTFVNALSQKSKLLDTEKFDKSKALQRYKVLLYETNQSSRQALQNLLTNWDIKTYFADNLADLKKQLDNASPNTYDLIILSLNYLEMNPEIFSTSFTEICAMDTPVVSLVNSIDNNLVMQLKSKGISTCLSKPPRHKELFNILHSLLVEKQIPRTTIYPAKEKHPLSSITTQNQALEGLNLLVAEDNRINSKLIEHLLTQAGAGFKLVENGKQALEAFNSDHYDMILMDIHMPELNGIEATKLIRASTNTNKNLPIIALTADALPDDQKSFVKAGINRVLTKPVNEDVLINAILTLCKPDSGRKTVQTNGSMQKNFQAHMLNMLLEELPRFKKSLQKALSSLDIS
ncbi:MAG: response regulator, partial [Gammaproteobacteria bacterium]|nr:response regulator [Gammaproteobacteria bacterium]